MLLLILPTPSPGANIQFTHEDWQASIGRAQSHARGKSAAGCTGADFSKSGWSRNPAKRAPRIRRFLESGAACIPVVDY